MIEHRSTQAEDLEKKICKNGQDRPNLTRLYICGNVYFGETILDLQIQYYIL